MTPFSTAQVLPSGQAGNAGRDRVEGISILARLPAAVGPSICCAVINGGYAGDITPLAVRQGADPGVGNLQGAHFTGILLQEVFREKRGVSNKAAVLHADITGTGVGPFSRGQVLESLFHGGVYGGLRSAAPQQHPIPAARPPLIGSRVCAPSPSLPKESLSVFFAG